jgi:hypothetical protein
MIFKKEENLFNKNKLKKKKIYNQIRNKVKKIIKEINYYSHQSYQEYL